MRVEKPGKTRLETWKEVATFFSRTERTVMRWSAERGLPVHRIPGQPRSRIFAEVAELEAWLRGQDAPLDGEPASVRPNLTPSPLFKRHRLAVLVGTLILGAMLAALAITVVMPLLDRHYEASIPPKARGLYVEGIKNWEARTPGSLALAIDAFNQAIRIAPNYAEAYAGLANCYNLAPEYTTMPTSRAYTLAQKAAEKAISLNDDLADAHVALAFSLYYGAWDVSKAQKEFERALALEPHNAVIQHWYATYLVSRGQFEASIDHINLAHDLDPTSAAISADRAIVYYHAGQRELGKKILTEMTQSHPDFRSPHSYLSIIYFIEQNDESYLREAGVSAQLAHDLYAEQITKAAAQGWGTGGHNGMLRALLAAREAQFKSGIGSAYELGVLTALLHDEKRAMVYLQQAYERHDEDFIYIQMDERLAGLRQNREFNALVDRLKAN